MARKDGRCRFWQHRWVFAGLVGLLGIGDRCQRCGWWKVFDGIMGEEFLVPPDRVRQVPGGATSATPEVEGGDSGE